jgi:tetratricopeptide (TPR) repeat protein
MLKDAKGLEVSTDSPEAIAAIDRFVEQALSYGNDALTILKAIEADPTCAIAYAHAAAHYLSIESAESWQQAVPYLEAANKYVVGGNEREQLYVAAITAWGRRDIRQAIAYHEEIADKYPRDLASVQRGQYHYFYQGDVQGQLEIVEKVLPANPNADYLYGMLAFGLEQCQRLEEAEEWGRFATALQPQDSWAHHAVAHVMETQGRVDEGIAWMESLADIWKNCNSMLFTHNWWHVALYYVEKEDFAKVLSLYDNYVWGGAWKQSCKDQVGAISLLIRLELRGVNVGDRWVQLADYLGDRVHEHAIPFQDLHYVYALTKAGRTDLATEMVKSMKDHTKVFNSNFKTVWEQVAIPAALGMIAHGKGDWEKATAELKSALPNLYKVGGSRAQHDLFEQVYLDAWLQADRNREALRLIEKRVANHRYIPSSQRTLAFSVSAA